MQLLRASSRHSGEDIDYNAILGETDGDVGVPHADVLVEFAEAILDDGDARLNAARQAVLDAMGADALGDAAGVAAPMPEPPPVTSTGSPLNFSRSSMAGRS